MMATKITASKQTEKVTFITSRSCPSCQGQCVVKHWVCANCASSGYIPVQA